MNKITTTIFERAYQSYLSGGNMYTYRFESKSVLMTKKYKDALKYLEEKNFIEIKQIDENKVKLCVLEKGIEYGNSMDI